MQSVIWPTDTLRPGATGGSKPATEWLKLLVDANNSNAPAVTLRLYTPDSPDGKELAVDASGFAPMFIIKPPPKNRTYWLSFDRRRCALRYGRGYHMEETVEKTWTLDLESNDSRGLSAGDKAALQKLFGRTVKMGYLKITGATPGMGEDRQGGLQDAVDTVEFDPLPLVSDLPIKVLDSSKVTLAALDAPKEERYMFSADLPAACKVLYDNVAAGSTPTSWALQLCIGVQLHLLLTAVCAVGADVVLDEKLAKAISHSIDKDFGYLRITLGPEGGDGPGIPYVLEIWPGGSRSPIHNHGGVCAVIKVLRGSIEVALHNKIEFMVPEPGKEDTSRHPNAQLEELKLEPLKVATLVKGDVTWMDKNWFQCHRLHNTSDQRGDFCATIQCYKYDDEDRVRWPGFDFLSQDRGIGFFDPESDMSYSEMRKKVLEEYKNGSKDTPTSE
ncbi:hypothetical protein MNEG_4023 [Monoraphidium neglectum]|uniref:Cysteine dioxygenase n=1 Tax=Monoraphidium neglectum TaxID=145388 RepID=A0A0D2LAX1_9CHLO|nr:hypothetical protein MNEG_4023 [Monoraphidium neglectum]KIZ03934.1 hypothetical protein MNEG_4023 [Monoraphidium neglectum]|eukprot:XP_013902953.1 hypothetical protein MNEG_4023 [Monoraphidium neglectum]